jgi:hypothetical protein
MEIILDKRIHIILEEEDLKRLKDGKKLQEWLIDAEEDFLELVVSYQDSNKEDLVVKPQNKLKIYDDGRYLVKFSEDE